MEKIYLFENNGYTYISVTIKWNTILEQFIVRMDECTKMRCIPWQIKIRRKYLYHFECGFNSLVLNVYRVYCKSRKSRSIQPCDCNIGTCFLWWCWGKNNALCWWWSSSYALVEDIQWEKVTFPVHFTACFHSKSKRRKNYAAVVTTIYYIYYNCLTQSWNLEQEKVYERDEKSIKWVFSWWMVVVMVVWW